MFKKPQTEATAVWKERYRASGLWWAELARRAPSRGIAMSAVSGTGQIYAWDVLSGWQRQLTHRREGIFSGSLSPDGSHVYYLRDEAGSETGHYVRVAWEGGAEQDLTPHMPPYAALYRCAVSDTGTKFAFTPTESNGFPLYCLDLYPDGTIGAPRELHRSPKLIDDASLSYNAEMAVVATTEHSQAQQYSLLIVETASGRKIGMLSDLPEGSVRAVMFSPLPGDLRLLCLADRSGYNRPLIWNPASGERTDLPLGDLAGDVEPLDWSLDGRHILLRQISRATQQLSIYDLEMATLTRLQHQGARTQVRSSARKVRSLRSGRTRPICLRWSRWTAQREHGRARSWLRARLRPLARSLLSASAPQMA